MKKHNCLVVLFLYPFFAKAMYRNWFMFCCAPFEYAGHIRWMCMAFMRTLKQRKMLLSNASAAQECVPHSMWMHAEAKENVAKQRFSGAGMCATFYVDARRSHGKRKLIEKRKDGK